MKTLFVAIASVVLAGPAIADQVQPGYLVTTDEGNVYACGMPNTRHEVACVKVDTTKLEVCNAVYEQGGSLACGKDRDADSI